MSEEIVSAPAEEVVVQVEAPTSEVTTSPEIETISETETEEKAAKKAAKEEKKSGFEKRVQKLNAKAEILAAEAAHWKAQALAQQTQAPAQAAPVAEVPKQEQFKSLEEYVDALTEFKLNQREVFRKQITVLDSFKSKATEFAKEQADYQEAMDDSRHVELAPGITEAIVESDLGPQLAYYLAKNPADVTRLNNLPMHRRLAELGKIEDKIAIKKTAPTAPAPKPAPAPVKPVAGSVPPAQKSIYEMTPEEFIAHRNKVDPQRKGR